MATIENFLLRFKVEGQGAIDKATKGIENLSNEVSQFGASTGPLNNALSGILGKLGPIGLAAGAAGGAFAALGLQAVNLAAGISDIAGATGIAEGTLLNFRTSVIEAGGSADEFGSIAAKLNQNVQNAASGNEKLQQSFKDLGVFVTDAGGKVRSTESILRDITVRFQQGSLSSAEYSAAVDLLGKNITKLDLGKLQAIADPVKDAEIQKLDEYAAAIDRVRDKFERSIITFFGSAAQQAEVAMGKIDAYYDKLDQRERELNQQGRTTRAFAPGGPSVTMNNAPGGGIPAGLGGRAMTPEEIAFNNAQRTAEGMQAEMAGELARLRGRTQQGGGFGVENAERLKREAEARRKEGERAADALSKELQTIKDMTGAYRRASQANMDRYTMQVDLLGKSEYEKELIRGTAEIEKKYGDQIAALEAKKATAKKETLVLIQQSIDELEGLKTSEQDIFEITAKQTFEYQQQQDAIARITGEIEKQIDRQSQLGDILRGINDQRVDIDFEQSLGGLSPQQQQIAKIQESARKAALEAGRAFSASFDSEDGLTPERAQELADGLTAIANGYKNIAQKQIEVVVGVDPLKEAFEDFKNNAMDTGKQMADSFTNFTSGMEDAFVKFAQTGKLSFKELANSIIADLIRIAVRRAIVAAVGGPLGSLFGFANGGPVMSGVPIMVGERGPELFVPQSAGKVISNSSLKGSGQNTGGMGGGSPTVVNYNIQAVDASSFRSLVAKDPSFIYAVTEQGRRSQPTRSR
jgi:lambda family phage tail tape measure protein